MVFAAMSMFLEGVEILTEFFKAFTPLFSHFLIHAGNGDKASSGLEGKRRLLLLRSYIFKDRFQRNISQLGDDGGGGSCGLKRK